MDYKTSGVDVEAGREFVKKIQTSVEGTYRKEVIGGLGGFGGLIRIPDGYKNPILVAGTDGVGTKLDLAQAYQKHSGVGLDLVAMCVNDVITNGAEPLFFLDYIATGSLSPEALSEVVLGISEGCKISGCALLGGETAEMPGFYKKDKYDLAGFCVAIAEESDLVDGRQISEGDQIIGIASSGIHSNGFSLVRKVLSLIDLDEYTMFGKEQLPLIETLLTPTAIYAQLVQELVSENIFLKGMAHITGGGLPENLPRCFPPGLRAEIDPNSWEIPPIFTWLQEVGEIPETDLWNTFNLGVGFCLVLSPGYVKEVIQVCAKYGFKSWPIGHVQTCSLESKELVGLPF